jgi:outer membrane protein assembly factor BamB
MRRNILWSLLVVLCLPLTAGSVWAQTPGTQKWAFSMGEVVSSPAVGADGTIYVGGSNSWSLHAIYGDSPGLASSSWPMFHHDLQHTGSSNICIFGNPSIPLMLMEN